MLTVYRDLLATGDLEGIVALWRDDVDLLLEAEGVVCDPTAAPGFERLCLAIHRIAMQVAEVRLQRLDGHDVPTPPRPGRSGPSASEAEPAEVFGVSLLETFDGYAAAQRMTPAVRREWRRYVEHLVEYVQHDDASILTADQLREWRDHLLRTPTRRGAGRKPVTVRDKYLTPVRAMLNWAVQERKLPVNAAAEVTVRVPKEAKLRDRDFTKAEAERILASTLRPVSRKVSPEYVRAQRWIPWLCAYTGARVNEFSQLRGQDVEQVEGIWTVRITPEAGTVKAKEARVIPIHPHCSPSAPVAQI